MSEPLRDDEIRSLGYEPTPHGWVLFEPDRRPPYRSGLCKGCHKFQPHPQWEGLCGGCMYWGPGDPHGLARSSFRMRVRKRLRERRNDERSR